MRPTSFLIVTLVTLAGPSGGRAVSAADADKAPTRAPPASAPAAPATRPAEERRGTEQPRPKPRPIYGVVTKVEDGALRLAVGDSGREVIVPVEPDTEILRGGEKAKYEDLEPNWSVVITQEKGLTRTIQARPPRPRPGEKASEKVRTKPADAHP